MIYLIGGPPRCGKTTLSRQLSEQSGISCVPADYLMSVMSPYIPKKEMKERLPRWYARVKTEKSNDRLYAEYTPQQIVDFYLTEAGTYWPGIENFIQYALHDNQDFIIEGTQLRPDLLSTLIREVGTDKFRALFLYKSGENIVPGLKANQDPNDWAKRDTAEPTYARIAQMIEIFGAHIKKKCIEYGLSSLDTSNDFSQKIEEAASTLKKVW